MHGHIIKMDTKWICTAVDAFVLLRNDIALPKSRNITANNSSTNLSTNLVTINYLLSSDTLYSDPPIRLVPNTVLLALMPSNRNIKRIFEINTQGSFQLNYRDLYGLASQALTAFETDLEILQTENKHNTNKSFTFFQKDFFLNPSLYLRSA